jgi:hypothetical protein
LTLPAEDRHRAYDAHAGEDGDEELENALFHCDLGRQAVELERAAGRACHALGLAEGLPGPACSVTAAQTTWGSGQLLLWARRLDLLDEISSCGWQLRRAARAFLVLRPGSRPSRGRPGAGEASLLTGYGRAGLASRGRVSARPAGMYIHVPFCSRAGSRMMRWRQWQPRPRRSPGRWGTSAVSGHCVRGVAGLA